MAANTAEMVQDGPERLPRWPQRLPRGTPGKPEEAKRIWDFPPWPKEFPKSSQRPPRWLAPKPAPRWAQDGRRALEDAQDGLQDASRRPI
eukprot:3130832-Pyramimonas_sp.AAC.1